MAEKKNNYNLLRGINFNYFGELNTLTEEKFSPKIDKLNFAHIFLAWTGIIVLFGLGFFFLRTDSSYLYYNVQQHQVNSVLDCIYFSFITATSTGFGDIVPVGLFKIISIFEVVFGLLLLAFVTSKLISIKQNVILTEIYEISFNEKLNKVRSSLLLFRQNLSRIITKIEDNIIRKREIQELYGQISALEDVLNEILSFVQRPGKKLFTKVVDPINMELILNSIIQSFEKMHELIEILNKYNLDWKHDVTTHMIERCLELNYSLLEKIKESKAIPEKRFNELLMQMRGVTNRITQEVEKDKENPNFNIEIIKEGS